MEQQHPVYLEAGMMPVAKGGCMHHNRELVKGASAPLVWWNFNLEWPFIKCGPAVGCCLIEGTAPRVLKLKSMHWVRYESWEGKVDQFDLSWFPYCSPKVSLCLWSLCTSKDLGYKSPRDQWHRVCRWHRCCQYSPGTFYETVISKQTSQELRMLSSVTINCQVTKIVMNWGSQLSVL